MCRGGDAAPIAYIVEAMGIGSILCGLGAFICMVGGFILTMVPGVGAALSFAAPILSLVGIVLGGISMSRAGREGETSGAGVAGLVISVIAFVLSLAVALTCGLCNACWTSGVMNAQNQGGFQPAFSSHPQGHAGNGPPPIAPVDYCARADACCAAYAPGDPQMCRRSLAGARGQFDPNAMCRGLIDGWRADLHGRGVAVPDACTEAASSVCTNHCVFADDGQCDDGRPGSDTDVCPVGSDCNDCGPWIPPAPTTPMGATGTVPTPMTPTSCDDSCPFAHDGECDDGRAGAHTDLCEPGTDCTDCGR